MSCSIFFTRVILRHVAVDGKVYISVRRRAEDRSIQLCFFLRGEGIEIFLDRLRLLFVGQLFPKR